MKAPKTIPRSVTSDPPTNYHELVRRGLRHCQDLGGDLWTDYNEHDPGVTILEQLCYALTELSYRTDFEIPDILTAPPGSKQPEQTLYTGDRILTCNPVTACDYRKLLYDRIKGLKNAWLVPVIDHPLGIQGLYRILVETREEIEDPAEREAIAQNVKRLMRTVRNLGEDLDEVRILKPQPIRVEGTIEIGPRVDPANILAQVLFAIQNSLIPFPQVQLIDELFRTTPPDQIWNGPPLKHGALDQASLTQMKTTIRVEEIAHIILQVPGVKRVKHLRAGTPPAALSTELIAIRADHVPRLDPPILHLQPSYAIDVELEGGFKTAVNSRAVWSKIHQLEADMRKNIAYAARSLEALSYLQVPAGKYRDIEGYFSIQHQFPAIYGLTDSASGGDLLEGLHPTVRSDALRQARVRQLKAYLLFFEQPLADYLAQLSHVAHLFSLDEELNQSYFYQPLACDPATPSQPPRITDVLLQPAKATRKSPAHFLVCVVDHRGEVVFVTRRLPSQADAQSMRRQIIESSHSLSNYRVATLPTGHVQLALHNHAGTFLALGQERFASSDAARVAAARWAKYMVDHQRTNHTLETVVKIVRREDLTLQIIDDLSRIVLIATGIHTQAERDRRLSEILASGIDRRNYRLTPMVRGGFNIHLYSIAGDLIAEGEEIFETEFDAEEGVRDLVSLVRRMALDQSVYDHHLRKLPEVEEITRNPLRAYQQGLARLSLQADRNYLSRRNRILDHLLARFSEHFDDSILERLDLRSFGEKDDFYRELIRWKIEFLRAYVEHGDEEGVSLGGGRARGFDYGALNDSDSTALSGLERRATLLLGLHGHTGNDRYHPRAEGPGNVDYHYLEKDVRLLEPERLTDESGGHLAVARERIVGARSDGEPDLYDLHHNFVFSSQDSAVFRQLLASGANPDNYRLHASGGIYHILFQGLHGDQATEIHHAHSRSEAENSVAALIRYFQAMRQSVEQCYAGERLHVLEHVLLRPHAEVRECCVHVCDQTSQLHLSSPPIPREAKDEHVNLIVLHGREVENYRITLHPSGMYRIELHVQDREIASGTRMFTGRQEAAAAIQTIVDLLRALHQQPAARDRFLRTGSIDNFYSHRVSVFLPSWPTRFQNNEFKLYAEQLLYENAPSHLAIECFWLSAHEMEAFEKLYREWKALKRAVQLQEEGSDKERAYNYIPALNQASDSLKTMIETLQKKQDNLGPPSGGINKAGAS